MKFQFYRGRRLFGRLQWRWRLIASNGEKIAQGESYNRLADCEKAVRLVRQSTPVQLEYLDPPTGR
jgi:uncharacterized protein